MKSDFYADDCFQLLGNWGRVSVGTKDQKCVKKCVGGATLARDLDFSWESDQYFRESSPFRFTVHKRGLAGEGMKEPHLVYAPVFYRSTITIRWDSSTEFYALAKLKAQR